MIKKHIVATTRYLAKIVNRLLEVVVKIVIPALIALYALCCYIYGFQLIKVPTDVPIEYDNSLNSKNEYEIAVDTLGVKIIFNGFFPFHNLFIIQYHLTGSISGNPGKRPYIKAVKFSIEKKHDYSRFVTIGEIELTPIIEVDSDIPYDGFPVEFDIKIGQYFKPLDWGRNEFYVHAFGAKNSFELMMKK